MAFPRRRHTQVAELPWRTDEYGASDQLVGGSVLRVDAATHVTGSGVVDFNVVVRGLTWPVAEANAESGGFLEQVLAEVLDVEVGAVNISLENAAVEADVAALETTARACDIVRGNVATFPPVDVEGHASLADWLRAEVDAWERAPENVKKEARCRTRMADLVLRCATAVAAGTGEFLRRAGDPVGPDSRGPVDGEGVRPAVVGVKWNHPGTIVYRDGRPAYSPEPAAVIDCDAVLKRAADNGVSFRYLDGSAIGDVRRADVDMVLVPPNYNVRDWKSVRCDGSQRLPGRNARYMEVHRFLWSTFFDALVDSGTTFDDSATLRRQHTVCRLQDETRPPTPNGVHTGPAFNPWVVNRPPGWQEPPRRRGARRAARGGAT